MSNLINIYSKCAKLPAGKRIFSKLICLKAPYFGTIKPLGRFEADPKFISFIIKNALS
jgi:hypothetical protein